MCPPKYRAKEINPNPPGMPKPGVNISINRPAKPMVRSSGLT